VLEDGAGLEDEGGDSVPKGDGDGAGGSGDGYEVSEEGIEVSTRSGGKVVVSPLATAGTRPSGDWP